MIAVCIYRCGITLALRSKYDVDGHYFIFALQILANLVGHWRYDVIQYDVVTVATLPHTAVVLYATI